MSPVPDPTTELQSLGVSKSEAFAIERVVTFLTPFFAAAATWVTGVLATNVPGAPAVDPAAIQGLEAAAFLGSIAIVHKWLNGRQNPALLGSTVGVLVGGVAGGGVPDLPADLPPSIPTDLPPVPAGFDPAPTPAPFVPAQGAVVGQA